MHWCSTFDPCKPHSTLVPPALLSCNRNGTIHGSLQLLQSVLRIYWCNVVPKAWATPVDNISHLACLPTMKFVYSFPQIASCRSYETCISQMGENHMAIFFPFSQTTMAFCTYFLRISPLQSVLHTYAPAAFNSGGGELSTISRYSIPKQRGTVLIFRHKLFALKSSEENPTAVPY